MYTLAMIIEILVSIMLIGVVLMQSSKGGGLAGAFGSSNMGAVFGVRRTSDFLSTSTQILATVFVVLALVINLFLIPKGDVQRESVIQSVPPAATLPPTQQPQQQPAQPAPNNQ